ncbi:MAG: VOC family protein [Sphingomonadales bacterium]|nr:VOC family protein [Sphingomonadales bacterium]
MFSHIVVGSNDLEKSKTFYDAVFAAIGGPSGMAMPGRLMYMHNGSNFMVVTPINGQPATHANGGTIGFTMTPEQADAWHAAGVANGGATCEDPPGVREAPFGKMYLAYLRDPDGNKLCAFHMMAQ